MRKHPSTLQSIAASWLSLKTGVKAWLFALNVVFLLSGFYLYDRTAQWVLLAYLASGPLLILFMVRQRGLTRLLGLAHLIPWVPLAFYLGGRLLTDNFGPRIAFTADPKLFMYLVTLAVVLAVRLFSDAWDVVRYVRGERYVFGSPEAVAAGASMPAPQVPDE